MRVELLIDTFHTSIIHETHTCAKSPTLNLGNRWRAG